MEATLGVAIRGDYRHFLTNVGWCKFSGDVVFGIGAPFEADVLRITLRERGRAREPLPRHLIPFFNNGAGDLNCIDTRKGGNPRVVCWLHESAEAVFEAHSFGSWLISQLDIRFPGA